MSTPWPATLPQRALADIEETVTSPKVSFDPEVGPPIERRRASIWTSQFPISFVMTAEQTVTFEDFARSTLAGGTLPFTMRHPRTCQEVSVKIVGDPLYRIQRFVGKAWLVSFNLMVLP